MSVLDVFKEKDKKVYVTGDMKIHICTLLAQYKHPKEIIESVDEKFDVQISRGLISDYKSTNRELIEKIRAKFLSTVSDIPIAQKRIRLERAEDNYEEAQTLKNKKDKVYASLQCLKDAREECVGKGGTNITFAQFNQFRDYTDAELLEEKKRIEAKLLTFARNREGKDALQISEAESVDAQQ